MAEPEKNPLGELSSRGRFVAFVNDYKELMTTIAFFVGGILWVFGYFATKEEFHGLRDATSSQNKIMHCLLQKHVQLLEKTQELKINHDELINVEAKLRKKNQKLALFDTKEIVELE